MGRHKKITQIELSKEEKLIPIVTQTSDIDGLIHQSLGETYEHALQEAFEWMKRNNEDPNRKYDILSINNYYQQRRIGKSNFQSVLVGYSRKALNPDDDK